jgi:hypothetical protein
MEFLANGWDNELYRLVVRLPRRALGAQIIKNEQRCLRRSPGAASAHPVEPSQCHTVPVAAAGALVTA